ncbi:MAG: internalization-related competence protein ComEC/Rec2 protein [Candidatus Beckwithbacteria bacterium GW2011_GWB1_47_15]|uniref:Internalization-related competence protein ComEC/Rec2 protein n=1 Tax=Candidatus Beckwithbacteria bacterium GW2011_GWB1_47_15 TaxID=1618371 RepID=A0A0G1RVE5_9BACT|nr:MAG: internalization-related competence protein ComEC/Rec2, competence protein ComEC protein [Candidatus Beckwithbacteria bacterium GW2011_GWC1_49_16]KKU35412.1 MAG: internalization-related competence protein ComEC/Rec2 protein [Candidatus Beckwithbacteria bacterium GW2011_GWA1_46_30]KKU61087.1 MAG: internalization-related competence protein ComEC/Rec2 protein [Candidatus Beckwithbacteria bacterium GW2011_GWB1_47_15]KKU71926.1 MAG: internalization-related competence protein ComEC/Rec2 protein
MFLLVLLVGLTIRQLPDDKLHLIFCDVGQGDATLISYKNWQMLVDGGPGDAVVSCLGEHMSFWDRKVEVLAVTHPQADHIIGLVEVVRRYRVEKVIAGSYLNDTAEFRAFYEAVTAKNLPVFSPVQGDKFRLGQVDLAVLWPRQQTGDLAWNGQGHELVLGAEYQGEINETSFVLKGTFSGFDFLLTGDIGEATERRLVDKVGQVEVLKVAHHGSKYSSSGQFLEEVRPEVAVISAGQNNRFGHPTAETLSRLEAVGAKVFRTDEMETIEIVSDGQKYWFVL